MSELDLLSNKGVSNGLAFEHDKQELVDLFLFLIRNQIPRSGSQLSRLIPRN